MSRTLQRFSVRLYADQVTALEALARRLAYIENRPFSWCEVLRRGVTLVLQAEGDRPLPNAAGTPATS